MEQESPLRNIRLVGETGKYPYVVGLIAFSQPSPSQDTPEMEFLGSGILVDPLHVLTCHHVCDSEDRLYKEDRVFVITASVAVEAEVEAVDEEWDLALLRLDRERHTPGARTAYCGRCAAGSWLRGPDFGGGGQPGIPDLAVVGNFVLTIHGKPRQFDVLGTVMPQDKNYPILDVMIRDHSRPEELYWMKSRAFQQFHQNFQQQWEMLQQKMMLRSPKKARTKTSNN